MEERGLSLTGQQAGGLEGVRGIGRMMWRFTTAASLVACLVLLVVGIRGGGDGGLAAMGWGGRKGMESVRAAMVQVEQEPLVDPGDRMNGATMTGLVHASPLTETINYGQDSGDGSSNGGDITGLAAAESGAAAGGAEQDGPERTVTVRADDVRDAVSMALRQTQQERGKGMDEVFVQPAPEQLTGPIQVNTQLDFPTPVVNKLHCCAAPTPPPTCPCAAKKSDKGVYTEADIEKRMEGIRKLGEERLADAKAEWGKGFTEVKARYEKRLSALRNLITSLEVKRKRLEGGIGSGQHMDLSNYLRLRARITQLSTSLDNLSKDQGALEGKIKRVNGMHGPEGLRGAQGERGVRGPKGDKGDNGPPGVDGSPGHGGIDGVPGVPGEPGAPGPRGKPGKDGEPGEAGPPGVPGLDGFKVSPLFSLTPCRSSRPRCIA